MPRPRFSKLPEPKRERILEISAREFAVHGYDGASLNHILETAGLSKGAAYYYFDDKADLFATVLTRYFEGFLGEMIQEVDGLTRDTFWSSVAEIYRRNITATAERPWILGLARAAWRTPLTVRTRGPLRELHARSESWFLALVRRGRELGLVRDDLPEDLLVSWSMALDGATDLWMAENLERIDPRVPERLVELALDTLHRLLDPPREPHAAFFSGNEGAR